MSDEQGVWFSYFDHAGWYPQPTEKDAREDAENNYGRAVFVRFDTNIEAALEEGT